MAATRIAAVAASSALLAAGLAGCAASRQMPAAPPPTPSPTSTAVQTLTVRDHQIPTRVSAPAGTRSVPWQAIRVTTERVYLDATSRSTCTDPQYVTLTTSATTVTIGVYATPLPPGVACADDLTTLTGYVQVPGGLHHRTLLHADTG